MPKKASGVGLVSKDKTWRQRLSEETAAVGTLDGNETPKSLDLYRCHSGLLQFGSNFVAQGAREIVGCLIGDAGGAKEKRLGFDELRLGPVQMAKRFVGAFHVVRRQDILNACIQRRAVEKKPECHQVRGAMLPFIRKILSALYELSRQLLLQALRHSFERSGETNELRTRNLWRKQLRELWLEDRLLACLAEPT